MCLVSVHKLKAERKCVGYQNEKTENDKSFAMCFLVCRRSPIKLECVHLLVSVCVRVFTFAVVEL